jgi:hypothetical protein
LAAVADHLDGFRERLAAIGKGADDADALQERMGGLSALGLGRCTAGQRDQRRQREAYGTRGEACHTMLQILLLEVECVRSE